MAGIIRNVSTVVTGTGVEGPIRNTFVTIISFFESHPAYTRIAANYGHPQFNEPGPFQVAGLGFGPSGSLTAVGEQAWAVYRNVGGQEPFDIFLGFGAVDPGSNPSGSWTIGFFGGGGIGAMWAWHSGSEPWAGTTFNDGSDTFIKPWKEDALLLPCANERVNGSGFAFTLAATSSRNAGMALNAASAGIYPECFLVVVGDDDGFNIFYDNGGLQQYEGMLIMERYIPYSPDYDLPYAMIGRQYVVNGNKVMRNYSKIELNTAEGITIRKPLPGRATLTGSYNIKIDYPRWMAYSAGGDNSQKYGHYFTSASNAGDQTVSEFPVHVGITAPGSKYGGYLNLFRIVPWTLGPDTRYGDESRYSLSFEYGVFSIQGSGSIPWSGSWTPHPSSSNLPGPALWHTSSFPQLALMPVTASNLFEDRAIAMDIDVLWRGRYGNSYTTAVNHPPPASSDGVILFTNYYRSS